MKTKICLWISLAIELAALVAMTVNIFVVRFPGWAVRAVGAVFIITVFTTAFFTTRLRRETGN